MTTTIINNNNAISPDEPQPTGKANSEAACPRATSTKIRIDSIVTGEQWQFRPLDPDTVNKYKRILRNEGIALPPVRVAKLNGVLILIDGWHRIEAIKQNRQTQTMRNGTAR